MTTLTQVLPIKWLKLNRFCELTGETPDAIQSRRSAGEWLDSIHVQTRSNRLYVSIEAYNRWVEQGLTKSEIHLSKRRKRPSITAGYDSPTTS
jgi:hypothetical protein